MDFLPYFTQFSQNFCNVRAQYIYIYIYLLRDGGFRNNRRIEIHIYDSK